MGIRAGDVLGSRYRAAQLLGRGGMGEVWTCLDLEEKRMVACKVVIAEHLALPWMQRMFQAEIIAVARLSHPGIVEVYDLITLPDGRPLLVMALRPGKPLHSALKGPRTWPIIRELLGQLLQALAHAHARSVFHLDLKPDNILLDPGPPLSTTLVDFGVARIKQKGRGAESWHGDKSVFGTMEYMAPEQWFGELERFGPWTDLYSVGVIAYELCTGLLPFEDDDTDAVAASKKRMTTPAPRLEPCLDGVPSSFVDLCAHLLELSPTDRPWCAADVLDELERVQSDSTFAKPSRPPVPFDSQRPGRSTSARSKSTKSARIERSTGPVSVTGAPHTQSPQTFRLRAPSARLGAMIEDAFNAEEALPTPGAYGLFGLRELPVLGRLDERRSLWDSVRATVERGAPRAVLLSGPAGTGKSRLARDAIERALELGLAVTLQTHWSQGGAADEGLHGLAENAFESRGSQGNAFTLRLGFFCERYPAANDAFAHEAEVLLRPAPDAAPDAGLPVRVATDVVLRAAAHRPVLLWLDDIQWSHGEGEALVRALAASAPHMPVCIIATERGGEAAGDYMEALDSFAHGLVRVVMQPLGNDATRSLVRGLLDLDDDLADLVARRSEGNPLFASQLVAQLVRERAVERTGGRYVLAPNLSVEHVVPPDMGAVWQRSFEQSGAVELDLMAIALVRDRLSTEVLDALAQRMGGTFDVSVTRALGSGLLRREGGLYAFAHGLFRDYLLGQIPPEAVPSLHDIAADALVVLVGREDVEEARAHHLFAADRATEALDAMLAAAMWSFRRAERDARRRRLSTLGEWASQQEGALAVHARALAELAHSHAETGAYDQANATLELAHAALELARTEPASSAARYESSAAWAAFREGQVMRLQGRVDEGARASEVGIAHARNAVELEVEALCLTQLGLDAYRRGDHPSAAPLFDQAVELARKCGNRSTEAQVLMTRSGLEAPARMEELCRAAVEMAREAGALRIELLARQTWTEALFRTGQRELARRETAELSATAQRRGLRQTVSMLEGVAACSAVLEGDWASAQRHRQVAETWGASTGAAPERATVAAVDLALSFAKGDVVAQHASVELLVAQGRTYREPHFQEIIHKLLEITDAHIRAKLLILDAAKSAS